MEIITGKGRDKKIAEISKCACIRTCGVLESKWIEFRDPWRHWPP
jgi:hypothetical protein